MEFEIAGDSDETADRVDPVLTAVDGVQARHPGLLVEQFGDAERQQGGQRHVNDDLAKAGELSIPITLIILIFTFGSLVAAGIPLLIGITSVIAALSLVGLPSQLFPVDDNLSAVILMIGLAVGVDYSLFYLRREREERATGRSPRRRLQVAAVHLGPCRADLRPDRDGRDGGHAHQRRQDLHRIRRRDDPGRGDRDVRVADRSAGLLAWLGDRVEKGRIPFLARRRRDGGSPGSGRRSSTG